MEELKFINASINFLNDSPIMIPSIGEAWLAMDGFDMDDELQLENL